jgi:hypothetical protein
MFCPQCGQQQVSGETRFCSRCGFLLAAVSDIVARGGALPDHLLSPDEKPVSPRKRGLKQGLFIFLLTFLFAPLTAMISMFLGIRPFAVGMVTVLFFMGGLLRMVYALMFESANPGGSTLEEHILEAKQKILATKSPAGALPPQRSVPVSDYVSPASGNWRDTNELVTPGTVTENTTRLLEKDQ